MKLANDNAIARPMGHTKVIFASPRKKCTIKAKVYARRIGVIIPIPTEIAGLCIKHEKSQAMQKNVRQATRNPPIIIPKGGALGSTKASCGKDNKQLPIIERLTIQIKPPINKETSNLLVTILPREIGR